MKKYLILSALLLTSACAAPSQTTQTTPEPAAKQIVKTFFKASPAPKPALKSQQVLGCGAVGLCDRLDRLPWVAMGR